MQQAATTNTTSITPKAESNRSVWIYTGYVGAAIALIGVLAYHFSSYLLK